MVAGVLSIPKFARDGPAWCGELRNRDTSRDERNSGQPPCFLAPRHAGMVGTGMAHAHQTEAEVAVVGGGLAGLTAAIALAVAGVETVLVAPRARADHRTTALLLGSVTALETLRVWEHCASAAAALRTMRIVDATARLLRAPEVTFSAAEIG